jgi:hypothetical protein
MQLGDRWRHLRIVDASHYAVEEGWRSRRYSRRKAMLILANNARYLNTFVAA